jgi:hypothetical protein
MANILTAPESGIFFDGNTAGNATVPVLTGNASGVAIKYNGFAGLEISSSASGINYLDRFSVDGANGRLFSVTDEVTGTIFSVNDAAGLPIIEVESISGYDKITIGEFGTNALVVSGSSVGIGTTSPSEKLEVNGNIAVSGDIRSSGTVYGSIYPIWAEEAADINDNRHEWSFGNGRENPAAHGIPIGFKSKLLKISINVELPGGSTTTEDVEIEVYKNGSATAAKGIVTSGLANTDAKKSQVTDVSSSNITFDENDIINFKTIKDGNSSVTSSRVCAWLQIIL